LEDDRQNRKPSASFCRAFYGMTADSNVVWRISFAARAAKNPDLSRNFLRIRAPSAALPMMIPRIAFQTVNGGT
jgi:hypothetical protein